MNGKPERSEETPAPSVQEKQRYFDRNREHAGQPEVQPSQTREQVTQHDDNTNSPEGGIETINTFPRERVQQATELPDSKEHFDQEHRRNEDSENKNPVSDTTVSNQ